MDARRQRRDRLAQRMRVGRGRTRRVRVVNGGDNHPRFRGNVRRVIDGDDGLHAPSSHRRNCRSRMPSARRPTRRTLAPSHLDAIAAHTPTWRAPRGVLTPSPIQSRPPSESRQARRSCQRVARAAAAGRALHQHATFDERRSLAPYCIRSTVNRASVSVPAALRQTTVTVVPSQLLTLHVSAVLPYDVTCACPCATSSAGNVTRYAPVAM